MKLAFVLPAFFAVTVAPAAGAFLKSTKSCIPPGMRETIVHAGNGVSFRMVVLGDNDIVSQNLFYHHTWEVSSPEDLAARGHTSFAQNFTFLDIGANLGYYTMLFASRGHKVLAVEPMTRNRRALEGSLCLNPHLKDLVQIVPAALVARNEVLDMRCVIRSTNYNVNIGNGFLSCGKAAETKPCLSSDPNCENVPVKTLDMVLNEYHPARIDVVKMDVENYECHVFDGGQALFQKYRPHMLQVETEWGKTGQCVRDEAKKYDYMTFPSGENTEMVENAPRRTQVSLVQIGK